MLLKLNNINFTAIEVLFLEDVDNDNVLVSKKISFGEKSYVYFIGYLYDDYKIKLLYIMLPKTSTHVTSYHSQTKWICFFEWRWWLIGKI